MGKDYNTRFIIGNLARNNFDIDALKPKDVIDFIYNVNSARELPIITKIIRKVNQENEEEEQIT